MTAEAVTQSAPTGVEPPWPPGQETYYEYLTARNRGLVDPAEQRLLRTAKILVAGCGSIGGAAVEPLIRLGAEHLVLAEPDDYELHNLNRQHARLGDVGCNKAAVLASWAAEVNPYAHVAVEMAGITEDNVADLVAGCAVVIDGVDVTASEALRAKFALHRQAQQAGVPVISGYDIAGVQLVLVYDYRRHGPVLNGKITEADVADLEPMRFLSRVLPLRALPFEIFPILDQRRADAAEPFPQLVYSARMFGVIASRLVLDLLAGRPVRRRVLVDVHHLTRPRAARARATLARTAALARMVPTAMTYRRAPRRPGQPEDGE